MKKNIIIALLLLPFFVFAGNSSQDQLIHDCLQIEYDIISIKQQQQNDECKTLYHYAQHATDIACIHISNNFKDSAVHNLVVTIDNLTFANARNCYLTLLTNKAKDDARSLILALDENQDNA